MLKIFRNRYTLDGIFGKLFIFDNPFCYTLEHSYDGKPKIPLGRYRCERDTFILESGPIETFEVLQVPHHTHILFHYGNFNQDSDGCILLGEQVFDTMISRSRKTFKEFMMKMDRIDECDLEVMDGTPD